MPVKVRRHKQNWAERKLKLHASPSNSWPTQQGALEPCCTRVALITQQWQDLYTLASPGYQMWMPWQGPRPWAGQVLAAETDFEGIGSWTLPAYSPTPGSKSCPEGRWGWWRRNQTHFAEDKLPPQRAEAWLGFQLKKEKGDTFSGRKHLKAFQKTGDRGSPTREAVLRTWDMVWRSPTQSHLQWTRHSWHYLFLSFEK